MKLQSRDERWVGVWWWLRSNHVDGLTFTEGRRKRFVVASVRWGGYQLDWIVCRKRWAWGNGVRKNGGCLKSIKWICGVGMSRGAEWGGDDTEDRWCLNTLNTERAGECVKKSTEGVLVSNFCHGTYPCQLEYGRTPWHQSGQTTPSEQHEQSDYSSRHARANININTHSYSHIH